MRKKLIFLGFIDSKETAYSEIITSLGVLIFVDF
jgi:hypothetical protein